MKLIVGYSMCKILVLGLVVSSLAAEGRDFKWTRGGDWYNYFDTGSWKVGETGANEEGVIPGEGDDDWVWTGSSANYYFDMNGSSAVIKGFTYTNSWDTRNLGIRNGTLTFTSSFTNYYMRPNLYAGGKLIHASTASSRLGFSAAKSRFTVKSGAELEMYGTAYINNSDFIVESGGKATFDFSFIQFDKDAFNTPENLSQDNLGIFNSGETSFPNGFTMHELTNSSGAPPNFYIRQKAGVMTLGSDMIFANPGGRNYGLSYFYLDGGTLHIIGDVEIYGFTAIEMTAGATANIEIDEGKMLDLTNMKFAENTTLNLIGSGTLKIKGNGPSRLNLAAFTGTINFVEHIELGEVSGYENTTFNIGDGGEHRRGVRIIANESFIDALEEVLILQEGWTIQREGKYFAAFPANQDPKVYYSKFNNDFFEYMNPEIWTTEKSDSAVSAEEYPGDNDYLYYGYLWNGNKNAVGSYTYGTNAFTHLHLLMGNKLHRIRGFNRQGANAYPDFQLTVSYGGLEIWETFTNKRVKATINANSRLEIAPTCHATFGWQGAINNYIIKGDGRFDCYGDLQIGSWRITNEANGTVNFSPKSFVLTHEGWHLNSCYFDNSGKMDFANGLIIRSITSYFNQEGPWSINQRAGTMRFGGPIVNVNAKHQFDFNLYGGTLKVDADVEMGFFANVGMPTENTTASIDVDDGKTLNWTNATFAAGTKLFKKGEGMLRLGANVPELVVSNGTLRIESAAEIASLTLSDGATFEIAASGIEIASAQLGENAVFTVDVDKVKRRVFAATLVRSEDAALLAAVKDKMSVPEDCSVEIDGNALKLVSNAGLKVIVR